MPASLLPLLPHIPAFLLVMFRLTGIFIFAPLFGSTAIPARVKVLLALVLAVCIYPMVPPQAAPGLSLWTMGGAVASELLIGVVIGYGASLPLIAVQMGGLMMGQQLGLGLAQVFSPQFGEQSDVVSQLFYLSALAIFITLDGHHAMLAVLIGSFESIPLGGFIPDGSLVRLTIGLLSAMIELAVRVAAPLLCIVFLETIAMGFVARTVPQLNILSLGFPLRIIVGLLLMAAVFVVIGDALAESIRETTRMMFQMFVG